MKGDNPFRRRRAIEPRGARKTLDQAHTPLGRGPEFDAIRRMLERWGPRARSVGDDGAIVGAFEGGLLVVSTDASVEDIHFRAGWLDAGEIGYRAAAAALSDLAAMGATPVALLSSLVVPGKWRSELDGLTDGIGDAAHLCEAPIVGGDMSAGSELVLGFTVLGVASAPLRRSTARAGDSIYVTGRLGGPAAALRALEAGDEPAGEYRERFARPRPRIREAAWLAERSVRCAIDISDGLAGDLLHIAIASGVGITVDLDRIPVLDGVAPLDAAGSGEEYELAIAAPPGLDSAAFEAEFGLPITEVGLVEAGAPSVRFLAGGEEVAPPPGFSHFTT